MTERSPAAKRPTIRDVAVKAGVSRGTVSRVLNGGHLVSDEARRRVERAIAETGYVVSSSARSLATGRSGSVGFLLTESQQSLFDDPNFATLYRGAAAALARRDLPLVLMVAGTPAERAQILRYVGAGHVDGVLLVSTHAGDPTVQALLDQQVPTISCGVPLGAEERMGYVTADDRRGGRDMARHLLDCGASVLGMISGPADTSGGRERLAGFLDVVGEGHDPRLIEHADDTREGAVRATERILSARPDIDGLFVASDLMAAGALEALAAAGRRVPQDVLLGGFDDSAHAASSRPTITTMRQPFDRISEEMVRLLLDLIDGRGTAAVVLPTELVVRESTSR